MNAHKILSIGATLIVIGILFVSFMGITRMMHEGQSPLSGMGCSESMSPSCFVAGSLDHLNAHGAAFKFFSLAISSAVFLGGLILLFLISTEQLGLTASAPPLVFISRLVQCVVSLSRFRFLSWLAVHFRTVPSFS